MITITLVAFLVLLLVSLASLTRVEMQVGGNGAKLSTAQQNAMLALNTAVGELQRYVGPDARVTSTAGALTGINVAYGTNAPWTGVWDAADTQTTPQTWLVSGNEQSAANAPLIVPTGDYTRNTFQDTNTRVSLVGSVSAGVSGGVVVPKVDVSATNTAGAPGVSTVVGRYAWWVGDEGVKARVNLNDDSSTLASYVPLVDDRQVAREMVQARVGGEAVLSGLSANAPELSKVVSRDQLGLMTGVSGAPDLYHAVSTTSRGVLATTVSGPTAGLKRDLSIDPTLVSAAFARVSDYTDTAYMDMPGTATYTRVYHMRAPSTTTSGAVVDGVAPVLTDFALGVFVFSPSGGDTALTVRIQPFFELWNPYTSELAMETLRVRIRNLPTITVTDNAGQTATVNLDSLLGVPAVFELPTLPGNDLFRFLPGRVQNWAGVASVSGTTFVATPNSKNSGATQYDFPNATSLPTPPTSLSLSAPGTTLEVELVQASTGSVLASYTSPTFDPLVRTSYAATLTNRRCVYRFRLSERYDYSLGNPGDWLTAVDPRSPQLPSSRFVADEPAPGNFSSSASTSFSGPTGSIFDRSASTGPSVSTLHFRQDVPVFELPRQPYTSVGALQHLGLAGQRPFALGNPWGTTGTAGNAMFDRYFFSGSTATTPTLGPSAEPFLNTRFHLYSSDQNAPPDLTTFRATPNARSSRYGLVAGAFNVNSVSVSAWEAVLASGALTSWTYADVTEQWGAQGSDGATLVGDLKNAFMHFPQSASETYEMDGGVPNYEVEEKQFYRRGVVELTAADRHTLATQIVAVVRARVAASGPYRSLQQFVDSGDLATALDTTAATAGAEVRTASSLGLPAATDASIDNLSSSYLSQADLMTALAPIASVRSDTFVVRAYGEEVNPATGAVGAKAWCEAIVQRVPEFVDPVANAPEADFSSLNSTNQTFGRRFQVVNFRWLKSDDI